MERAAGTSQDFPSTRATPRAAAQPVARGRWLAALLLAGLFGALAALLLAGINLVVNAYDEGFALYGAARVLAGEVPYRDFWVVYAPGQLYTLAALFGLFGETVLVERLWDTAARLAILALVYALTARLASRPVAVAATLFAAVPLATIDYYGYAVFPALACSLLAVRCWLAWADQRRARWLVAAGAAVGASTFYRHDIGAYTLVPISVMTLALVWLATPAPRYLLPLARRLLASQLLLAAGVLAVLLPVTLYLLANVPPLLLWDSLVVYPLTINRAISYLPYPPLLPTPPPTLADPARLGAWWAEIIDPWLRFYLPPLVCLLALLVVALRLARRPASPPQTGQPTAAGVLPTARAQQAAPLHSARVQQAAPLRTLGSALSTQHSALVILALLGLMLFNHTLNRFDRMHALPPTVIAIVLVAVLLPRAGHLWRARWSWPLLGVATAALVGVYLLAPLQSYWARVLYFWPLACHAQLARAACVDLYPEQEDSVAYLQARTAPDERIFVGLPRHDRVWASDIILYFLANRHAASRYHELISGVANTLPVQQEIVGDLERQRVRYVVITDVYEEVSEPNASALSSGVTLLDDYLRANFQPAEKLGAYTVWERRY